jgi:hypothetical protein
MLKAWYCQEHTALGNEEHGARPVVAFSGVVQCRLADGVLGVDPHKVGIAEARNRKNLSLVCGHMQCRQLHAGLISATHTCGDARMHPSHDIAKRGTHSCFKHVNSMPLTLTTPDNSMRAA